MYCENLRYLVFSHPDHRSLHCSYSRFQSHSILLSKLPILGYFLEPIPFSVLKQSKIKHSGFYSQNTLQNFKLVVQCQQCDGCRQVQFNSLNTQLVLLMEQESTLTESFKMGKNTLMKQKVLTCSSILKLLNKIHIYI